MTIKIAVTVPGYSFLPFLRYGYRRFVILELNAFSNGVNIQFRDN